MPTKTRSRDPVHPLTIERHRGPSQRERPVLLATLAVPLDPTAIDFALACALESGHPLVIAGFIEVAPGRGATLPAPQLDAILQPAIDQLSPVGLHLKVLKVRSPRPLQAIVEIAHDTHAGLLAFGPDLAKIRPRRYLRAARYLTERAPCLLWLAQNSPVNA
jgi:hypothetical protein